MLSDSSDGDSSDSQSEKKMLLEKIQSIEKRVIKLKEIKQDLQRKLEIPIPFSHIVQRLPADSQDEIDHQYGYEVEMVMQSLFKQKLAGMVCLSLEKRQMVLEVNACVQGHLYEPFYLRISKEEDKSYKVLSYTMPYSIHIREMVEKSPLVNATVLMRFLQRVQCCVECYYSRKLQITKAKELWKKFFYSLDYMFAEISFLTRSDLNHEFSVTISLIYEADKDIPSSSDIYCREADPDTLEQIREEFDQELKYFTQMPLDEAIAVFKESLNEQSSNSASTVIVQMQEEELESEDDESEKDEEPEKDDSAWSDLMKGSEKNPKKLRSSKKPNFPSRKNIGSRTGRGTKRK